MNLFETAVADVKAGALIVVHDLELAAKVLKTDAIQAADDLFNALKESAVKGAQQVEAAVLDGSITKAEKRSSLVTNLEQQAQTLGYSLEQQGVAAAINLAVEFGVNFLKLLTGGAVGAPVNPPKN
jgi:hypothetical protein